MFTNKDKSPDIVFNIQIWEHNKVVSTDFNH